MSPVKKLHDRRIDQIHVGTHYTNAETGEHEFWVTLTEFSADPAARGKLYPKCYKKDTLAEAFAWKQAFIRCALYGRPQLVITKTGAFTVSTGTYPQDRGVTG